MRKQQNSIQALELLTLRWAAFNQRVLLVTEEVLALALATEKKERHRPQYLRRLQARSAKLRNRREKIEIQSCLEKGRTL